MCPWSVLVAGGAQLAIRYGQNGARMGTDAFPRSLTRLEVRTGEEEMDVPFSGLRSDYAWSYTRRRRKTRPMPSKPTAIRETEAGSAASTSGASSSIRAWPTSVGGSMSQNRYWFGVAQPVPPE